MKNKKYFIIFLIICFFVSNLRAIAFDNILWDFENSLDYQFDDSFITFEDGSVELSRNGNWFNEDWIYRKKITINNNNGLLADFQIKLSLNGDNFDFDKADDNGYDIRVVKEDGVTLVPFWLEEYNASANRGEVWFKAESLNIGENYFYIYYGNPEASDLSSGESVFMFFDDNFNDIKDGLINPLTYLNTPTYDDPSGQAIHPDIYYNENGWNGWKYWMANTSYTGSNDDVENPSILVSNNGLDWSTPAGLTNPIVDMPEGGGYNSDPDLIYNSSGDYLMYYYRETQPNATDFLKVTTSTNGVIWSSPVQLVLANDDNSYLEISPSVVREDSGTYKMWYVGAGHGTTTSRPIYYRESIDGVNWQNRQQVVVDGFNNYSPWHINVRYLPEKQAYFMLISANTVGSSGSVTDLYLATSNDGLDWSAHEVPILQRSVNGWDRGQIYRADLLYDDNTDNLRLWYSARSNTSVWHTGYTDGDFNFIMNNIANHGTIEAVRRASTTVQLTDSQIYKAESGVGFSGISNQISNGGILINQTFTNDIVLELKHKIDNGYYADVSFGSGNIRSEVVGGNPPTWHHTVLQNGYHWMWGGASDPINSKTSSFATKRFSGDVAGVSLSTSALPSTSTLNEWHKMKYIYTSSGVLMAYHDDVLWQSATDVNFLSHNKRFFISQGEYSNGRGGNREIDYLLVRQYAQFDPILNLSEEESQYSQSWPTIKPNEVGPTYTSLSQLSADIISGTDSKIQFQISNDGGETFYWWNDIGWEEVVEKTDSNSLEDINDNISNFPAGIFMWRAYLISNGRQPVSFNSLGLSYVNDAEAPTGSFQINGGQTRTNQRLVAITLSAQDNYDQIQDLRMQIAENSDFNGASWQYFQSSLDINLIDAEGAHTIYVRFADSLNNISQAYSQSIIYDTSSPLLSNLSSQVGTSSAFINWNANETIATGTINYGATDNYGLQSTTAINDNNYGLTISNLLSCSTYYYDFRIIDLAGNISTSSTSSFTTLGCVGNATIEDSSSAIIGEAGGQLSIGDNNQDMLLDFPAAIADNLAVQIKSLEVNAAQQSIGLPSGYQSWQGGWYQINLLDEYSQQVTDLSARVSVTMNYALSQIEGLQTSTLALFRYHGDRWQALEDCHLDEDNRKITCETNQFSIVALFGRSIIVDNSQSTSSVSGGSLPCEAYIPPVISSDYISLSNGRLLNGVWQLVEPIVRFNFSAQANVSGLAISSNSDFSKAAWQQYKPTVDWSLCALSDCQPGPKELFVRFYNAYGLSSDDYQLLLNYEKPNKMININHKRDLKKEQAMLPLFIRKYGYLPKSSVDWSNFQTMVYSSVETLERIKQRDLIKERGAINWFINYYKKLPKSAADWKKVNLRAYGF